MTVRLTHGRHCRCSACAREDWTNPSLAPCGMHGASCPAAYAPIDAPLGSLIGPVGDVRQVWGYCSSERRALPVAPDRSGESIDTCLECDGTGEIEEPIEGVNRPLISTCIACNGSGVVDARARLEGEIADG